MGEALNDIKIRLINQIALLDDAQKLTLLDKMLGAEQLSREDWLLWLMGSPVREKTNLEDLIQEQNYQGPDRERFEQAARNMNLQEPVDELVAMLTK